MRKNTHERHKGVLRIQKATRRVGAAPGSLPATTASTGSSAMVTCYGPDGMQGERLETLNYEKLSVLVAKRKQRDVIWIDQLGPADADTLSLLGKTFALHPLALEDAASNHQRPKAEAYAETLYVAFRVPTPQQVGVFEQISLFLGEGFVVTIQENPDDTFASVRKRIELGTGRIHTMGADYLAYSLLDTAIDQFFPHLDDYVDRLDAMEHAALYARQKPSAVDIYTLRMDLRHVRRILWATREAVHTLVRDEANRFSKETRVFLRDCHDHTAQLLDVMQTSQSVATGLLDLHTAAQGERMNEIVRVLTLISTVFMPLSFIAGVYGMNFQNAPLNMPELRWPYGYLFVLGLMGTVATGFLIFFVRKGWLGTPRGSADFTSPLSTSEGIASLEPEGM